MASYLQPAWQGEETEITGVVPIRNKCWRHLRRCLESLCQQTAPLRVVVVDFGSIPRYTEQARRLVSGDWARLVEVRRNVERWHEARALNIGIRQADTPYVFVTNADLIFAPNFVSVILSHFKQDSNAFVVCRTRIDLDKRGNVIGDSPNCYYGTCLAASSTWWNRVRGFNEKFLGPGFLDMDVAFRAKDGGLKWHEISDETEARHQYHRHIPPVEDVYWVSEAMRQNREIYYGDKPVICDQETWGEL